MPLKDDIPMMRQQNRQPATVKIAFVGLLGLCLVSSARFIFAPDHVDLLLRRPWSLAQYDHRFDALRRWLPARGVVGYLGNQDEDELANYLVTQYSLAPILIDHSADHALVIGNFSSAALATPPRVPANLRIVHDFGGGLFLLEERPLE